MKYYNIWVKEWGTYVLTNYDLSPINGTANISCSLKELSQHGFPTITKAKQQHKYYYDLFNQHAENMFHITIITEDELKLLKAELKLKS